MKRVIVLFVLLVLIVFCFFQLFNMSEEKEKPKTTTANITAGVSEEIASPEASQKQIYAVWLTYSEIGSLVKGKSEAEYRKSIEDVFKNLKENKINTVFYQCRAFCDSFYKSDIFPVSKYITTDTKKPTYDPFEIFLEKAENYGVSVHCWVNPYRISYDSQIKNLLSDSPAKKLYKEDKNSLIICEKGIFLNPAKEEARELVLSGIRELLEKYKVAGIHFDDYFYPEADEIKDASLYEEYKKQGGIFSENEWRRENVNALISGVFSLVKSVDKNMIFSISPGADIEKCKNVFYADVEKWCREEGFVDYIIPQIYFGFENEAMPFEETMRTWESLASKGNVKLVCGLAGYKCGYEDENAGTGKNEWNENVNILSRQYEQMLENPVWQGFSLFSYSYCFGDNMNHISKKEIKNLLYMVE